ncbi:MAG: sulfatase-like hydrolase/transferase, partial [Acidobacteriota bacterium]
MKTKALLFLLLACLSLGAQAGKTASARQPNVVLFYIDDLGYADVGSFNQNKAAMGYATPNIDRMAAEGIRLTSFYVTQAVCSASRAALLTGCYSNRVGISGALDHRANYGINPDETTLGEVFKSRNYSTAIYGKWHLGHHPQFLPTRHGFDEFF